MGLCPTPHSPRVPRAGACLFERGSERVLVNFCKNIQTRYTFTYNNKCTLFSFQPSRKYTQNAISRNDQAGNPDTTVVGPECPGAVREMALWEKRGEANNKSLFLNSSVVLTVNFTSEAIESLFKHNQCVHPLHRLPVSLNSLVENIHVLVSRLLPRVCLYDSFTRCLHIVFTRASLSML